MILESESAHMLIEKMLIEKCTMEWKGNTCLGRYLSSAEQGKVFRIHGGHDFFEV